MTRLTLSGNAPVIRSKGASRKVEGGGFDATNPFLRHFEQVWIEDSIPAGAIVYGTWTWDTTKKASGTQSSTIGPGSGIQQYYFAQSPDLMAIDNATEAIVVYALLDPCNPPQQILFQFRDGTWDHRAYWGDNLIPYGTNGTNSRRRMGDLPPLGLWVRLVIPISRVGLGGDTVSGMAFDVEGGRAWFDRVARVSCSMGVAPPASFPPGEDVWVEDDIPTNAGVVGTWIWDTTVKASGTRSHTDPVSDVQHSHYFYSETQTMSVGVGDTLFAYVLLSACDPPDEIFLQWNDGSWEHRGYWGANLYPYGTDGTNSLRRMGNVPAGGQWVRLEIPAAQVGLEGHTVNGLSFDLMGGKAWFDRAGVQRAGSGALAPTTPTAAADALPSSRPANLWAWIKRIVHREPPTPVSLAVTSTVIVRALDAGAKNRYSLYTPELSLMAETAMSTATNPPIAYEYVWFGGAPVAQIETATNTIHWYFNDHLGTPILTTSGTGAVDWRVEREPYGLPYVRTGGDRHQPLGLPGQESSDEVSEQDYNIFRWYRTGWGRYTQADPMLTAADDFAEGAGEVDPNDYGYALDNPVGRSDPYGLFSYQDTKPVNPDVAPMITCLENCVGQPLVVNAGKEGGHKGESKKSPNGHAAGNAADFSCKANPGLCAHKNKFFCCAGACDFGFYQFEPKGKYSTGDHFHVQKNPHQGSLGKPCKGNCDWISN